MLDGECDSNLVLSELVDSDGRLRHLFCFSSGFTFRSNYEHILWEDHSREVWS